MLSGMSHPIDREAFELVSAKLASEDPLPTAEEVMASLDDVGRRALRDILVQIDALIFSAPMHSS